MNTIIFFIIYNLLYSILDIFYKKYKKEELFRKIAHIWTWIITFISLDYLSLADYSVLVILFLIEFIFIRKYDLVKFMTSNKRWYWDLFFIIWQWVLIWFSSYNIVITKAWLLLLTLADWLAPFWKNIYNKKLYREKTFGGSIIFFLISLLILSFYFSLSIKIFLIALFLTIIELISFKWLDNVLIPIFTIIVLYFYDKIFYL